ncbi:6773_t:CDS:2 [Ambispora gerdemannii]|uniref:6773_t:CDS:1 n=1 Tax=Ambispora gerdemannii TaxID=144530 RepID=A0A9N9BYV8_9GLOM|nr:6773_t:CDS:2 [Ambispora gerdemannii]
MSAATYRTKKSSPPGSGFPTPAQSRDSSSEVGSIVSDTTRKKHTKKKDEAIRKKVEQELTSKKKSRANSGAKKRQNAQNQKQDGTVASLRPTQALTVRENFLVEEAAQFMAAKRADCVLVIDHEEHLSGIFTAKDLAFRVVGEGLDARNTTVAKIMTHEPKCVKLDTSATFALETMVDRGFRHLVNGDVVGLLDITKCLYEALDKMERAYGSSKKLYDALEGVEKEWSNQPTHLVHYLGMLRDKMSCPTLATLLDERTRHVEVGVRTTVRDAARLMRQYRTTAVLVMEHGMIAGIFTSKDIVLRVIAAGLDPATCSVARVMTPHPDTAPSHTSILDALKKMYDGHYLNLPVVDDGHISGMIDVLRLTYATMEQMNSTQAQDSHESGGGPMWGRFWNSFANDGDNESIVSDSISPSQSASNVPPPSPNSHMRGSGHISPIPEIHPSESASAIDDNGSLASFPRGHDENFFTFKFKSPSGKTHRFTMDYTNLDMIRHRVASQLPKTIKAFSLAYVDDDNDHVLMSSDDDVVDAVRIAQRQGLSRVLLLVQEIDEKKPASKSRASRVSQEEDETASDLIGKKKKRRSRHLDREIVGNNNPLNDWLLPAAVVTLAAAIVGVFAISKISGR